MGEVVGRRGEADRVWTGFSRNRAVEWTRVLRVHWPSWPGTAEMLRLTADLREGLPASVESWAERARTAEAIGFVPATYDRLHRALDAMPAVEHPAHPDNEPDPRWPVHTIRAWDPELWWDWLWLVDSGWSDEDAAGLLLTARELLP